MKLLKNSSMKNTFLGWPSLLSASFVEGGMTTKLGQHYWIG
jgi:hypothetical protein